MTKLRELIIALLINKSLSVQTISLALGFAVAVVERELQLMVAAGEVVASVNTPDGPAIYHLSDGERHHCRQLRRQRMLS